MLPLVSKQRSELYWRLWLGGLLWKVLVIALGLVAANFLSEWSDTTWQMIGVGLLLFAMLLERGAARDTLARVDEILIGEMEAAEFLSERAPGTAGAFTLTGVPNAFGLLGAEANAVAPGKRPLSSMSPTIVLSDGQPVLTIGAAGGPRIITQVLLGIIHHLDLEMPIQDALAISRFHHQWAPDRLYVERTMGRDLVSELKALGHRVEIRSSVGISQAISYDPVQKQFSGVHDPRIRGKAAGF